MQDKDDSFDWERSNQPANLFCYMPDSSRSNDIFRAKYWKLEVGNGSQVLNCLHIVHPLQMILVKHLPGTNQSPHMVSSGYYTLMSASTFQEQPAVFGLRTRYYHLFYGLFLPFLAVSQTEYVAYASPGDKAKTFLQMFARI